jgi:hypothetical protein
MAPFKSIEKKQKESTDPIPEAGGQDPGPRSRGPDTLSYRGVYSTRSKNKSPCGLLL